MKFGFACQQTSQQTQPFAIFECSNLVKGSLFFRLTTIHNSLQRKCLGAMVYSVTCAVHQGSPSTILTGSSWQHPATSDCRSQTSCSGANAVRPTCCCDLAWLRLNHTLDGFCILRSYPQDIVNYSTCSSSVYSFVCNPPRTVEVK